MAGYAFDSLHDLSQRIWLPFFILKRSKEHMDMGRHHYECMHMNFAAILKQTMIKNQRSGFFWKHKVIARAEIDEI